MVDNNGFVVISEDPVHSGKFFGEVDGTILESLIQHDIFRPIKIYDYQAICLGPEDDDSAADILGTVKQICVSFVRQTSIVVLYFKPFRFFKWAFNYILGQIAWTIIHLELRTLWNPDWTYAYPSASDDNYENEYEISDGYYDSKVNVYDDDPIMEEFSVKDGLPIPLLKMDYINKTKPKPCDKEVTLFELNDEKLYKPSKKNGKPVPVKGKLSNCHESECER